MVGGISPLIGALVSALVMSLLVSVVATQTAIREDTAVGLLFVGMLALGVVVVSRNPTYSAEVTALLFGDVLGVTASDIRMQLLLALIVALAMALFYRAFLALTFNKIKAQTLGMRPQLMHAMLLVLLALSIVASFRSIGTLLVFGLLVGPPATASLVVHRVPLIMTVSMLFGSIAVVAGLVVSFHHGTAGSATIAGFSVLQFFIVLLGRQLLVVVRRSPSSASWG